MSLRSGKTLFEAVPALSTVAADTTFRFVLLPRDPDAPNAHADVEQAMQWLQGGLANLGAGAKTGVGYGFFVSSQ